MRNVNEIATTIDMSQQRPAVQLPTVKLDEGTTQVVNALFNELKSIFPGWKQAWPDDTALGRAKRTWIKGLMASGITTLEQIRFGLETCRASKQDFAPSVGKFVEWCQPTAEQLGLPPTQKAFQEAARNSHPAVGQGARWTHPAVHHAAIEAGLSNLFRLNEDAGRKLFERNYVIACRMVAAGQPLREIPKALPAEVSTPAKPETVTAELAKMRAALGRRS